MNEERNLEKIGKNKFKLTVKRNEGKVVITNQFTRDELRDHAARLKKDLKVIMVRKGELEKQIKKLDVEDSEELRQLREQILKVQKLEEKVKLEENLKGIVQDIENLNVQLKELKGAVPEAFRNKD